MDPNTKTIVVRKRRQEVTRQSKEISAFVTMKNIGIEKCILIGDHTLHNMQQRRLDIYEQGYRKLKG